VHIVEAEITMLALKDELDPAADGPGAIVQFT